uniref:Uncharacterized protein n=1 Tax=Salarias fasciatus TaxID=181472 RepID=A0A672H5Q9_SALFA
LRASLLVLTKASAVGMNVLPAGLLTGLVRKTEVNKPNLLKKYRYKFTINGRDLTGCEHTCQEGHNTGSCSNNLC